MKIRHGLLEIVHLNVLLSLCFFMLLKTQGNGSKSASSDPTVPQTNFCTEECTGEKRPESSGNTKKLEVHCTKNIKIK